MCRRTGGEVVLSWGVMGSVVSGCIKHIEFFLSLQMFFPDISHL